MKYTVLSAIKEREFQTQHGTFVSYLLSLKDESGAEETAKLSQKPETPAPSGELNGHLEETPYGKKFVKEKPAFTPGGNRTSGFAPRDPAERASIERQVSLKAAVELGCAMIAAKKDVKAEDIIKVAQAFDGYLKGNLTPAKAPAAAEPLSEAEAPQEHPVEDMNTPPWNEWLEKE